MILDCAGFAHRGDQRITSVSTQAKPNYSMKSKAATHNRAPPCGDSVKHHRPIEYAADLTPVVAAEAAGASWNARRIFASRKQYGGTVLAASFTYVTARYAEVLERTRKRLGSLGFLGASSAYIFNLLFQESLLIALSGTTVGIAMTYGTVVHEPRSSRYSDSGHRIRMVADSRSVFCGCRSARGNRSFMESG
jgi:hypothetical protein